MNKPFTLTAEQREEIVRRYVAGESGYALSRAFGIAAVNVYALCKTRGIPRRNSFAVLHAKARAARPCNDAAFDVLTPDALYWIGFLWADGCIQHNRMRLSLSSRDEAHVESFRAFCGCGQNPITVGDDGRGHLRSGVTVYSLHAAQRLAALGFKGTKRDRVPPPELASSSDFWRGVIDGDGTVGVYCSRGRPSERVSLVGGHGTVNAFLDYVRSVTGEHTSHASDCGNYAQTQFSGKRAYDLMAILYGHGGTALARKIEKATTILRKRADVPRQWWHGRKDSYMRRAA